MKRSIQQYQDDMRQLVLSFENTFPLQVKFYTKLTLIQPANIENNSIWILKNGLAKQYDHSHSGNHIITGFWKMGEVMMQPLSFLTRRDAEDNIILVEDSHLSMVTLHDIEAAELADPNLEFTSALINVSQQRTRLYIRLFKMNSRDALYYLSMLYPLSRLSQKDVASFLGKDPSTLTRAGK